MKLTLPPVPDRYSPDFMQYLVGEIERFTRRAFVDGEDVVIVPRTTRLVLIAPDGSKHKVVVDDAGALSTEAVS